MSARGRFLSGLGSIVVALAGFVTVGALPAAATNSGTVQYVALGDSYAAGQGAPPYLDDVCKQSRKGYPALLDPEKRIHLRANATCSGATTSDVATTQLTSLSRGTRLVTLTVGGNDLDVSGVAMTCTTGTPDACQAAINKALALLVVGQGGKSVLGGRLTGLYADIAAGAPNALVVVTGYPYLFEPPAPSNPNAAIITAVNNATTALNATILQAVAAMHTAGVNIVYVDVTNKFKGHGIGSRKPFINPNGPDAFHPNAAGYRAYEAAISAKLPSAWLAGQTQLV